MKLSPSPPFQKQVQTKNKNINNQVRDQIQYQIQKILLNPLWYRLSNQICVPTENQIRYQILDHVLIIIWNQIERHINNQLLEDKFRRQTK